jgi:hypothetical protein
LVSELREDAVRRITVHHMMERAVTPQWVEGRNMKNRDDADFMKRLKLFTKTHANSSWEDYTQLIADLGYHPTEQVELLAVASIEYFRVFANRVPVELSRRKGKVRDWQKDLHALLLRMPDYLGLQVKMYATGRQITPKWRPVPKSQSQNQDGRCLQVRIS